MNLFYILIQCVTKLDNFLSELSVNIYIKSYKQVPIILKYRIEFLWYNNRVWCLQCEVHFINPFQYTQSIWQ